MNKVLSIMGIVAGVFIVSMFVTQDVDASEAMKFSDYLSMIAQGQIELLHQNNAMIQQQQMIINELQLTNKLLMGNSNIYVAGVTDQYIPMEFIMTGQYMCYDRIQQEIVKQSCELGALTKNEFKFLVSGKPEN